MAKISFDPMLAALLAGCLVVAVSIWHVRTTVFNTPINESAVENVSPQSREVFKPNNPTLNDILSPNEDVSVFVQALKIVHGEDLEGLTGQTLLIPANEYLSSASKKRFEASDPALLTPLVNGYIVPNQITESEFKNNLTVKSLSNKSLRITKRGTNWYVNTAKIISADYSATPSAVFYINTVL